MSTIEELKKLQNFNINNAKPLTVRGQYSENNKVDINKTIQSISLLTNELNNLNSSIKQSSLNIGNIFSMKEWVNSTSVSILNQITPSIQTLISNQKPISKNIILTNSILTSIIQSNINQQDDVLNQLEDYVFKILDTQNIVKVKKDENGNVVLTSIIDENAKKSLDNVIKILSSTTTIINKINTRISNKKPLKNIDDFVNNLSLEHIIEFAEKIIAVVTLALQIKITIRKIKNQTAAAILTSSGNLPAAEDYIQKSTEYTATEQRFLDDLSTAQSTISIIRSQINFYKDIIQSTIDKLKEILNTIETLNQNNIPNNEIQNLINSVNNIIIDQQENTSNNILNENNIKIVRTSIPNYAAKIIE